ncbi:tripartite tricarboxylate transporter permease [Natronosalvus rutilus]|uniref:Tripartite tricarboxylate transporter permease n=1 Tax=Natronosalvus rutilus TaxID=2953753 RepID=A0A9E7N958_9EURY|nr:tripartite tricarboxylate transporter permease [Natronosalvus rutilus]UTF52789.1 tripartite tricarboxylate transporter permease [Natronosalvus rutilus]
MRRPPPSYRSENAVHSLLGVHEFEPRHSRILNLRDQSERLTGGLTNSEYQTGGLERVAICCFHSFHNTIFALFALVAIGQPRSGVMVAFQRVDAPLELPILLSGIVLAGVIGFALVIVVGDAYLELVGRLEYWRISAAVLSMLVCLAFLFAGPIGVLTFGVATVVGLVLVRLQARRVHLMGVLIDPLALSGL